MLRAHVRFYDEATPEYIVTIGAAEDLVARRDLHGLDWDDTATGYYQAWLAARREHKTPAPDGNPLTAFYAWVADVADVETIISEKMIRQAVAIGEMTPEQADQFRALNAAEEDAEGESQALRTA